jgi:hypothetical protein
MIFSASGIVTLGRFYFFLASAVAAASVAVNSGMLGNGVVAHTVANCVLGGITVWFIDIVRKNRGDKSARSTDPSPANKGLDHLRR